MIDFANKTVAALREDAKAMSIVGYSKMRKAELVAALEAKQKEIEAAKSAEVENKNDSEIRPRKLNRHQRRRAVKLARLRAKSSNLVAA